MVLVRKCVFSSSIVCTFTFFIITDISPFVVYSSVTLYGLMFVLHLKCSFISLSVPLVIIVLYWF